MELPIDLDNLRAAKINFENVAKQNPQLNGHPLFRLAMSQLDEALGLPAEWQIVTEK